jgi:hypothetical protein
MDHDILEPSEGLNNHINHHQTPTALGAALHQPPINFPTAALTPRTRAWDTTSVA